jgi:hypothetical protein
MASTQDKGVPLHFASFKDEFAEYRARQQFDLLHFSYATSLRCRAAGRENQCATFNKAHENTFVYSVAKVYESWQNA